MKLYRALVPLFNKFNDGQKVATGDIVTFSDERRAEENIKSGYIEEVKVEEFKENLDGSIEAEEDKKKQKK